MGEPSGATTYWTLTEPALGETPDDPGGLVRRRDDNTGLYLEALLEDGTWEDRMSAFLWLVFDPTHGEAVRLTAADAERLRASWPPPKLREGFRAPTG